MNECGTESNLLKETFTTFTGALRISLTQLDPTFYKDNNKRPRKRCQICSKLTIKNQNEVIVNFEHISHLFLPFLLFKLNK